MGFESELVVDTKGEETFVFYRDKNLHLRVMCVQSTGGSWYGPSVFIVLWSNQKVSHTRK